MSVCTFFGHRDCPNTVQPQLWNVLQELIEQRGVDVFYVGNQGQFDAMVRRALGQLSREYPHIRYGVVLAYVPKQETEYADFSDAMLPEGIEAVHPRYAITWRNRWMLKQSDYVVSYAPYPGGAAQWVEKAKKQGKAVLDLHTQISWKR